MEYYASDTDGTGGHLRDRPADFRVRELEAFDTEPLDADPGAYPYLVLRAKLNDWDTNDFAARIADALGMSRERVGWAGTKDKRAVTTQLFSIDRPATGTLPEINGAELERVGRAGRSLQFGDLVGNAFEIRVREPERPEQAASITTALQRLATGNDDPADDATDDDPVGVPNYFGQQRFGSRRPITHTVGEHIVREDWEGAVMAYLADAFETEPDATREAREFVGETRDWAEALERFPRGLGYERALLNELQSGSTFQGALDALPTNLQRLFVHAAQSYAFNRIVSERLARGLPLHRPVAGDVVCFAGREGDAPITVPDTDRTQRVAADQVETVARHCERGRAFVTAPLVGVETTLADGEQGDIERAVLDDLGYTPDDFALPEPFHSAGTRRAMLVRTAIDIEDDEAAQTYRFSLPKGSYATVLLREYLKVPPTALS
jgi:tRNA pseudouridine13 synthase